MQVEGRGAASPAPVASLMEISRVLEETARIVRRHAGEAEPGPPDRPRQPEVGAAQVRAILALRALRRKHFGVELSDAGWAMMLELYAARLERRLVYQTGLGLEAGVPQTTALNTARKLLDCGLFVGGRHPDDKRLLVLGLSDEAAGRVATYLATARQMAPLVA